MDLSVYAKSSSSIKHTMAQRRRYTSKPAENYGKLGNNYGIWFRVRVRYRVGLVFRVSDTHGTMPLYCCAPLCALYGP